MGKPNGHGFRRCVRPAQDDLAGESDRVGRRFGFTRMPAGIHAENPVVALIGAATGRHRSWLAGRGAGVLGTRSKWQECQQGEDGAEVRSDHGFYFQQRAGSPTHPPVYQPDMAGHQNPSGQNPANGLHAPESREAHSLWCLNPGKPQQVPKHLLAATRERNALYACENRARIDVSAMVCPAEPKLGLQPGSRVAPRAPESPQIENRSQNTTPNRAARQKRPPVCQNSDRAGGSASTCTVFDWLVSSCPASGLSSTFIRFQA